MMDVNYFLQREQIELMRAKAATSDCARIAHRELAGLYRNCVESHRQAAAVH